MSERTSASTALASGERFSISPSMFWRTLATAHPWNSSPIWYRIITEAPSLASWMTIAATATTLISRLSSNSLLWKMFATARMNTSYPAARMARMFNARDSAGSVLSATRPPTKKTQAAAIRQTITVSKP